MRYVVGALFNFHKASAQAEPPFLVLAGCVLCARAVAALLQASTCMSLFALNALPRPSLNLYEEKLDAGILDARRRMATNTSL